MVRRLKQAKQLATKGSSQTLNQIKVIIASAVWATGTLVAKRPDHGLCCSLTRQAWPAEGVSFINQSCFALGQIQPHSALVNGQIGGPEELDAPYEHHSLGEMCGTYGDVSNQLFSTCLNW
jgi:hypothetical protein